MSAYSDAWQALKAHHADTQHVTLRERFAADAERFNNMHEILHGLLFDYSKNRLDENTLDLLCQLAEAADLPQYMQAMSSGEKINTSEHRAVLHTALRLPANAKPVYVDGENIVPNV
ncbi:glucose-6-phosphate isomerase, partial [Neisseria sp. P0001.S005]